MKMSLLVLSSLIVVSGCAGSGSSSYGGGATATSSYLVSGSGRTIYQFSGDSSNVSNCTGSCLAAWPIVTGGTSLAATSGSTPQSGLISSFTRTDGGGLQATYSGKPLYYFVSDSGPGVVSGNGVDGFSLVSP